MPKTSERTSIFTESVIRRMTRVANRYDAINLSQGFPDFDPPPALVAAQAGSAEEGKDGTKEITVFDPSSYRTKIAAEVSGLNPEDHFTKKEGRRLSRWDQFGLIAFREAWSAARLNRDPVDKNRAAVILGAGSGGILSVERYFRDFYQGLKKPSPSLLISYSLATTTDHIALEASLKGPRSTTATVCSSSSASLGVAYEMIQMGLAEVMVSGGSDSLCEVSFSGFSSLKLVDSESCKPSTRGGRVWSSVKERDL